jgi:nucleotide-binding universal stress UspA family protein
MFSKILVATDGSDNALRAAGQVTQLVKKLPAKATLISVAYVPAMYRDDIGTELSESFVNDARQALLFTKEVFAQEQLSCETKLVQDVHPADAILEEVQAGEYDLVVLGTRGLSEREAKRLGSVSQEVARRAECSVLLVR